MNAIQYKKLRTIDDKIQALYYELKNEECGTDLLLAWCGVGQILTKELLGDYKKIREENKALGLKV